VKIGNVVVGGDRIVIVAGPCAVESHDQAMTIAKQVKNILDFALLTDLVQFLMEIRQ